MTDPILYIDIIYIIYIYIFFYTYREREMANHGDISRYLWSMSPDNDDMGVSENEYTPNGFKWPYRWGKIIIVHFF